MKIDIKAIKPSEHRYPTVGDWYFCTEDALTCPISSTLHGEQVLHIRITKMPHPYYEALLYHHELTEAILCYLSGVETKEVDEWDKIYENRRIAGDGFMTCGCPIREEPGDDIHAPYHSAHATASLCERQLARTLGVDWGAYEDAIDAACGL
jgi:hypothetical protein